MIPSCFNCRHLDPGHSPTFDDPGDGWGCKNEEMDQMPEEGVNFTGTDDEVAQAYAENCSGYEFFDWEAQHRGEAEALAEDDRKMKALEPELEEMQRQGELAEEARLIGLGLLTPDGNPTNEYYRQADFAYQVWRERR